MAVKLTSCSPPCDNPVYGIGTDNACIPVTLYNGSTTGGGPKTFTPQQVYENTNFCMTDKDTVDTPIYETIGNQNGILNSCTENIYESMPMAVSSRYSLQVSINQDSEHNIHDDNIYDDDDNIYDDIDNVQH